MAKRKKKRIASRGSVNNAILKSLVEGDKYGYEIIKEVEDLSGVVLKQPSLYSSLSRFEEKGYVNSYWTDSDIGGKRHYYHITDSGMLYYQQHILKLGDDDEDIDDYNNELNNFNGVKGESIENSENIKELDDNDIPAIVNFDKVQENEPVIIPDHQFFTHTPMDKVPLENNTSVEPIEVISQPANNNQIIEDAESEIIDDQPWKELSEVVKSVNKKISTTPNKKLHFVNSADNNKNINDKSMKVILDKDGIYKLREANYTPTPENSTNTIFDNVGGRRPNTRYDGYSYNYGYDTPQQSTNSSLVEQTELTEEERRIKNETFLAKFNMISKARMKPVDPKPEPKTEKKPENIDYLNKLNKIIEDNAPPQEKIYQEDMMEYTSFEETDNQMYNYDDEDDKFVDFDNEGEKFETKENDTQYIEEMSNYTAPTENVKINRYEMKPQAVLSDKTYVLINKLRFVFGIILGIILFAELIISQTLFKNNGLYLPSDKPVYIVGYIVSAILVICLIIPFIINHNQHKCNNFKFRYAFGFGLLTFLVSVILIYCINALCGFELDNFNYFRIKLIVPAILTFNFVIAPIIYSLLIKSTKFYD